MANEDPIYVNAPGGVIAHTKDGSPISLTYGQEVPVDRLADHVDPSAWSDNQRRLAAPNHQAEAQRRAALEQSTQLGSSADPVPQNYGDLDEDTAARVISNLAGNPGKQAHVLRHEIAFGGNRQKVVDAASSQVRELVLNETNDAPVVDTEGNDDAESESTQSKPARRASGTPKPSGSDND